jgi:hypothetical protein
MAEPKTNNEKQQKVRTGGYFWGVFLILVGLYFLFVNFGMEHWDVGFFINLWPLAIIFWGVSLLKISPLIKKILAGVSGGLIALFIIALVSRGCHWMRCFPPGASFHWEEYDEDYPDSSLQRSDITVEQDSAYRVVNFKFSGGAGDFDMEDFGSSLLEINGYGNIGRVNVEPSEDSTVNVYYEMNDEDSHINISERRRDFYFNRDLIWNFDINVGACDMDCDFSKIAIETLEIDAGAADIDITLGDLAKKTLVNIETGVSDVSIDVPDNVGCEIRRKTGFSSTSFDGFEIAGEGVYRSPDFHASDKKIFIEFKGGMSSFDVDRYR